LQFCLFISIFAEREVDVSVRFTSLKWNDKLSDKKSEEFANTSKTIIKAVGSQE
jgi:hypothetical protein